MKTRACIEIANLILIYTADSLHLSSNVKGLGAWFSYFYTSMKGLFIDMELRNIYTSAGFAFQSSGKSALCDSWALCFGLFGVSGWTVEGKIRVWTTGGWWVRGSIMKCEVPHQWVICVNQVGFGIGWK